MDTKAKGDIAEFAIQLKALRRGWDVLVPVGDRLPYDLVVVTDGRFCRLQVKSAWRKDTAWIVDHRRHKTNRMVSRKDTYAPDAFDFLIAYIHELDVSYVMPIDLVLRYSGVITLSNPVSRQRQPKAAPYLEAWEQIYAG